jgi:chromosome segregation ATPase
LTALALLVHAKQEKNALAAKVQEKQAKDEATIAGLRETLSRHETELLVTSAQNLTLTGRNEEYKTSTRSKQDSINTLSEALSNTIERVAQREATISHLKEAQAEYEATSSKLREQLSTLEAQNRVFTKENEAGTLSMQESIDTLSKDLSKARETAAQHDATITSSKETQVKCEGRIAELRQQLLTLDVQICALTEENEQHKISSLSLGHHSHTLSGELSSAREMVTQHEATITDLKEAQVKQETTSAELRQQISKLEAQNRTWTEESEECKSNALFMQESIQTLSQDLLHAIHRVDQHQTTITELKGQNLVLESGVVHRDKQIASLSQTCEEASSKVIIIRRELEQKTKESADWRDLYTVHRSPNVARLYQERRRQEASQSNTLRSRPSLATIIATKDQEIARLIDRVSECHSQLALCQCSGLNSRLQQDLSRSEAVTRPLNLERPIGARTWHSGAD